MAQPVTVKPQKSTKSRKSPSSDRSVSDAIAHQLKSVYDEVLSEPVPPELSALVEKLSKEASKKGGG